MEIMGMARPPIMGIELLVWPWWVVSDNVMSAWFVTSDVIGEFYAMLGSDRHGWEALVGLVIVCRPHSQARYV